MITRQKLAEYLNTSIDDIRKIDFRRAYDWVHKKTGNLYTLDDLVIDTTNSTEGRIMVIYHLAGTRRDFDLYVRELKEFLEKFECPKERI
ncbi:MAG: hypothetical protein J1F35_08160 [Erysipelotrichales bacterium]|nr:hypothetical protein [Erysipelotrichales bacterium]